MTSSSVNDDRPYDDRDQGQPNEAEDLIDEQDVGQAQAEPQGRDELDDLIDNDQQTREMFKEEVRRRWQASQQPARQERPPEASELDKARQQLQQTEQSIDNFFETPHEQRNYEEFERAKVHRDRLERRVRELERATERQEQAVRQAPDVVNEWIREQARQDPEVKKYADRIRSIAHNLKPHILADENTLREALQYMVEPNAYKQYIRERRKSQRRSRETPTGDAYMDEGEESRPRKQDRYADASDEERDFLKRVGLLKEEGKRGGRQDEGIYKTPDGQGYYIGVGPGRKNRRGEQS